MRTPLGNNQPDKVRQSRLSTARATVSVRVFWPSNFHQRVRQKPVRPLEERAHVSSAVVGLQKVHILLNGISTRETRALAALIHKRQQVARCRNGCLCFAERPIAPVDQAVRRARLHFRGQRALAMLRASSVDLPRWCFPICQDGTHAHTHAPPLPSTPTLRRQQASLLAFTLRHSPGETCTHACSWEAPPNIFPETWPPSVPLKCNSLSRLLPLAVFGDL